MPADAGSAPRPAKRTRRHLGRWLFVAYLVLLGLSHLVRALIPTDSALPTGLQAVELRRVDGSVLGDRDVVVTYRELSTEKPGPAVVMLHGSPGSLGDFHGLAPQLAERRRVVIPSLPGFGRSAKDVPDYSIAAHADYTRQLLDTLGISQVHVIAFSMGGGVALELYEDSPKAVVSLALISTIGVQELELLGNYDVNHIIHGAQLAGLWLVSEAVPHFGLFDDSMLNVPYARNFYDTDQRPLRGILERFEPPLLIQHGPTDPLVPYAAALEHHRIAPHSELIAFDGRGHFLLWQETAALAEQLDEFFARVESGEATTRVQATPDRLELAAQPFAEQTLPTAEGLSLVLLVVLIVLGTFITEDLTCILTGLMIAHGRMPWEVGLGAAFAGIYFGDQLLYFAGRRLGREVTHRAPWKWFISDEALELAGGWFERRGMAVIFLSRFVPGTRLPTYVMAGIVRARYWVFALYFFVAVAVWTPLLVGLSVLVGYRAEALWKQYQTTALLAIAGAVAVVLVILRVVVPLMTHRGRRLWLGRLRRIRGWEFWPPWIFYPPLVPYLVFLSLKYRGFATVTAVNPAIPAGGFVGESKADILQGLSDPSVAKTLVLSEGDLVSQSLERVRDWGAREGVGFPLVLKPDRGQRGEGVHIVRDVDQLERCLSDAQGDQLVQEYVDGLEFGVFYARHPDAAHGTIFSITEKRLPVLVGDGERTLERLILDDDRAVCMARTYFAANAHRLGEIPAPGQKIRLVELGTHCRGAIFLDGSRFCTDALEARIDEISRAYDGFYFGRYDLKVASADDLAAGQDFKILELNGLTSEATHIYDPRLSLAQAYGVLRNQWRLAFEIGAANRARGAKTTGLWSLLRLTVDFYGGDERSAQSSARGPG